MKINSKQMLMDKIEARRIKRGLTLPIFLARRPGGGVTELRTHEQGLVGV
jgi:hypothetical protein